MKLRINRVQNIYRIEFFDEEIQLWRALPEVESYGRYDNRDDVLKEGD